MTGHLRWVGPSLAPLLWLGALGAAFSTLAVLGAYHWSFDLLTPFRVQYVAALAPALLVALALRRFALALLFSLVLSLHGTTIIRSLLPEDDMAPIADASRTDPGAGPGLGTGAAAAPGVPLRLVSANLRASSTGHAAAAGALAGTDADLVVLLEYTFDWQRALSAIARDWPHRVEHPRPGAFGIALWSRHPIARSRLLPLDPAGSPSIEASVSLGGRNGGRDGTPRHLLTLIATHPVPPIGGGFAARRDAHLGALGARAAAVDGPLVVAGDLNVTPWSPHFERLTREGGLRDARRGIGLRPTWPTFFPPALIPIDHVLLGAGVRVVAFDTGADIGSDHRSVVADLVVPAPAPRVESARPGGGGAGRVSASAAAFSSAGGGIVRPVTRAP